MNIKRHIYTWISFHGITDLLLPIQHWLPVYNISLLSLVIPMNILNCITFILSGIHFSYDITLNYESIFTMLLLLVYFGKYTMNQYIILSYMSLIHVPNHLMNLSYDASTFFLLAISYILFYNCEPLMNIFEEIVTSGGRSPNNYLHKLLLGFINSHIVTNLLNERGMNDYSRCFLSSSNEYLSF